MNVPDMREVPGVAQTLERAERVAKIVADLRDEAHCVPTIADLDEIDKFVIEVRAAFGVQGEVR